jgi:hypothetical protein
VFFEEILRISSHFSGLITLETSISDWFEEPGRREGFEGNLRVPTGSKNQEEEKIFHQENLRPAA